MRGDVMHVSPECTRYLTEAMGDCYHKIEKIYYFDSIGKDFYYRCTKCNSVDMHSSDLPSTLGLKLVKTWDTIDFNTWDGFGKLFEWARKQKWWHEFAWVHSESLNNLTVRLIHPDRFSSALYKFLKERRT
jgi:hypothetical protein